MNIIDKLLLDRYKKRLLMERERVEKQIEIIDARIGQGAEPIGGDELADYDQHPADVGTETFEKEKDISMRDYWRDILDMIDHALEKIDSGTYGICENCGAVIPRSRLSVIPYAMYCTRCQEEMERS